MRRSVLVALAGLAVASPALAQDQPAAPAQAAPAKPTSAKPAGPEPDFAYGAYQAGRYITAQREANRRLEKDPNDAAAMTLLGQLSDQGLGTRQDPAKAAEWYRLAAAKGDPHALFALGMMAIEGRGMDKNPQQGRTWLEQAAAKGEPAASYNLALLLLPGENPADLGRAVELLHVAAEAEIGDAQHALGVLYLKGRGVTRDPTEAARWFRKASDNGSIAGTVEYAILLFNGEGVPADEALAARYFRRAAAEGNPIAQNRLARLYAVGRGVAKNLVEAAAWHMVAAAKGLTDPWLDQALRNLPADDRAKAEKLAAQRSATP